MSDDARTDDETIPMVIEPTGQVTKLTTNRAMELLGDQAVEIDRLRARVAELETAGDRVVDLVDGESDLPGVVRDVVDDLRRAVRGER